MTSVTGYRVLTPADIALMNEIKAVEASVAALWHRVSETEGVLQRPLSIARTELQTAFMWFVRAVAQPADPFQYTLPNRSAETQI